MSIEWNSIRLSDPAHWVVTRTVHKNLPGGGGVRGGGGQGLEGGGVREWWGYGGMGWWGSGDRGGGGQG